MELILMDMIIGGKCETNQVDLILMDMLMKKMGGVEATRAVSLLFCCLLRVCQGLK